jgi:hypothetical protein
MMRDLDPEDARAIIDPALKVMIDAAHAYDGYVAQSTGDGIFALFGAPVAHEDHPQRALRAEIAMRDALRRSGEELRKEGRSGVEVPLFYLGKPLRHRIEPLIRTPACQVAFRQHTKTVEPTEWCETTHLADAFLGSPLNGQRPATHKSSKHQMRCHTLRSEWHFRHGQ